jgi:hypothetical protein
MNAKVRDSIFLALSQKVVADRIESFYILVNA